MSEKYVAKIRDILLGHKGKENAIFSGQIAKQVGIDDVQGGTHVKIRKLIWEAIQKYELPIAARSDNGYYYITNQDELFEYFGNLSDRSFGIEERKRVVRDNYVKTYGEIENEEEEE
jgi:hypothetical protein